MLSQEKQDDAFYEFMRAFDDIGPLCDSVREQAATAFYTWISGLRGYRIMRDNSSHRFLVPVDEVDAFEAWCDADPQSPRFQNQYHYFWSMSTDCYDFEAYLFE